MDYKLKIHKSLKDINSHEWDKIAKRYFMKTNFLEIAENQDLTDKAYYLEIYQDEELVCIAVLYPQKEYQMYFSLEETLYGKYSKYLKKLFLDFGKTLICHMPYAPSYNTYNIKEGKNTKEIFIFLLDKIKETAKKEGYKTCALLSYKEKEYEGREELEGFEKIFSGYHVVVDISSPDFNTFISNMSKNHRSRAKKELNKFDSEGYKLEIKDTITAEEKKEIYSSFEANFYKYGFTAEQLKINNALLDSIIDSKAPIKFFIVKKDGKITASLMSFIDNYGLINYRVGQNNQINDPVQFFKVSIYGPLKYAYDNNIKSIDLGTGSYKYKVRRGGKLISTYSLIYPINPIKRILLKPLMNIVKKRNIKKHNSRID